MHTLGLYKHIIDGMIQETNIPHPLEGNFDKKIFIKRFVENFENMTYEDISDGNNKLYKINYNNCVYNVFIEAFDGGGRDRTDGSKKISITTTKAFKKLIKNGESVLIINEYVPLHTTENGDLILDDVSIYGIIKPKEIYSSKVIRDNTGNPSSRWVGLDSMIESLTKEKMVMNNMDNVYVIPSYLLKNYFDLKIIDEQYEEMAKYIFEFESDDKLSEERIGRIFRERLINKNGLECEFCNCNVDISDQLIASHINSRSNIRNDESLTSEEKFELMADVYNGFLLCRTHDALFDKKHITFTNDGKLIVSPNIEGLVKEYNIDGYIGKKIINIKEESIKYLATHQEDFCKQNKINSLDELLLIETLMSENDRE